MLFVRINKIISLKQPCLNTNHDDQTDESFFHYLRHSMLYKSDLYAWFSYCWTTLSNMIPLIVNCCQLQVFSFIEEEHLLTAIYDEYCVERTSSLVTSLVSKASTRNYRSWLNLKFFLCFCLGFYYLWILVGKWCRWWPSFQLRFGISAIFGKSLPW